MSYFPTLKIGAGIEPTTLALCDQCAYHYTTALPSETLSAFCRCILSAAPYRAALIYVIVSLH